MIQAHKVKKQRPVNLQLNTISFPPTAIVSILHRATGVAMFFALMFVIWAWAVSVNSLDGFNSIKEVMAGPFGKFVAIGTVSALIYHVLGGVRHVIMDMGHWEEIKSGNNSAVATIVLWLVLTVVVGIVLW
jgi:succinate dehydrogenase / fumarate reductase cytochrome b subunit